MKDSDEMRESVCWSDDRVAPSAAAAGGIKHTVDASDNESIKIHCVIERNLEISDDLLGNPFVELETETAVSGSVLLQDLVDTVLTVHGFDNIDRIGAKGAILPTRQWQPISLDSVGRNRKATVRDVFKGIDKSATLKIQLQRNHRHLELQVTDTLLRALLLNISDEHLRNLRCPLDQELLHCLRNGKRLVITESELIACKDWLTTVSLGGASHRSIDTTNALRHHSHVDTTTSGLESSSNGFDRLDPKPASLKQNAVASDAEHRHGPVIFDPSTELPLIHAWFRRNPEPPSTDLIGYAEELNNRPFRRNNRPGISPIDLENWFRKARQKRTDAEIETETKTETETGCRGKTQPSIFAKSLPVNGERKRRRTNSEAEVRDEPEVLAHPVPVPHLPNKNAVYVVQPLPPEVTDCDSVDLDSPAITQAEREIEVISDAERPLSASSPFSSQDGIQNDDDSLDCASEKRSSRSDENHNFSISGLRFQAYRDEDEATDLSLASRRKTVRSNPRIDWKPVTGDSPAWPVKKQPTDPQEYEPVSRSPSPRSLAEASLHGSLPGSFMYPPYPVSRVPHVPQNAIQMVAMSQLLQHTAAVAFYNAQQQHPQPVVGFTAQSPYEMDDRSSSGSRGDPDTDRRKRSRVFIDPNTEIPRLEQWYREETHPSAVQIEQYTNELNSADYRQRFPKLETKNVQLWFKNHRAKVKRLQGDELMVSRPDAVKYNDALFGRH